MMFWFEDFAKNLAEYSFWPLVALSVVSAAICIHATKIRKETQYASPEYTDAKWRQMASAQLVFLGWMIWAIIAAVPDPNYQTKVETVIKIKEVSVASKYDDFYKTCRNGFYNSRLRIDQQDIICNERALNMVAPNGPVRTQTLIIGDSYKELFNRCMGSPVHQTNSEVEVSHKSDDQLTNERIG